MNGAIGSTSTDANGRPCIKATDGSNITDPTNQCGFPGFDGALAKNTLGEVAQMQEHGVPVTFAYISDAHDDHTLAQASGPGEARYQKQLADYDAAFDTFFKRLDADGINKSNTLFVVTVDEGDHFAGGTGTPDPANPGALTYTHAPCPVTAATPTCPGNQIGEITTNLKALLPATEPPFSVHSDDAPTIYVNNQPNRTDPSVRQLARDIGSATAIDPYQGGAAVPITDNLADSVEEEALHMVTADPKRTPTLTLFGQDDFFFQTANSGTCSPSIAECVDPKFAWNHGDDQQEIANTWLAMVGPGVDNNGVDDQTWTDHVDARPTMLALLGLQDPYVDDGRVITQIVNDKAQAEHAGQARQDRPAARRHLQADQRAVRPVRHGHADGVDDCAQAAGYHGRQPEVRLDRDIDRKPDVAARCARGSNPAGAERRGQGGLEDRPEQREDVDQPGAEPARPGSYPRDDVVAARRAPTSEASSSRQAPGSRPSSVSGP